MRLPTAVPAQLHARNSKPGPVYRGSAHDPAASAHPARGTVRCVCATDAALVAHASTPRSPGAYRYLTRDRDSRSSQPPFRRQIDRTLRSERSCPAGLAPSAVRDGYQSRWDIQARHSQYPTDSEDDAERHPHHPPPPSSGLAPSAVRAAAVSGAHAGVSHNTRHRAPPPPAASRVRAFDTPRKRGYGPGRCAPSRRATGAHAAARFPISNAGAHHHPPPPGSRASSGHRGKSITGASSPGQSIYPTADPRFRAFPYDVGISVECVCVAWNAPRGSRSFPGGHALRGPAGYHATRSPRTAPNPRNRVRPATPRRAPTPRTEPFVASMRRTHALVARENHARRGYIGDRTRNRWVPPLIPPLNRVSPETGHKARNRDETTNTAQSRFARNRDKPETGTKRRTPLSHVSPETGHKARNRDETTNTAQPRKGRERPETPARRAHPHAPRGKPGSPPKPGHSLTSRPPDSTATHEERRAAQHTLNSPTTLHGPGCTRLPLRG